MLDVFHIERDQRAYRGTNSEATPMPVNPFEQHLYELHEARFREYEQEVLENHANRERATKLDRGREPARRKLFENIGIDTKKLDAERQKDEKTQAKELAAFLDEVRPKVAGRRSLAAADAKYAAVQRAVLTEAGQYVHSPYANVLYAADRSLIADTVGNAGAGQLDSGWVFPDEPGRIRIRDFGHVGVACFEAYAAPPPPEFSVHFAFVPAATARYEMTAVLAFHGFYILRSDDSWWNCRSAFAKLHMFMNVHQYVDVGWKNFPALIDRREQNADLVKTYDRTNFFDYTTVLKAGDPVVVTVRGTVEALGVGGHTYAELNFEAGTANYIEPFLLSVQPV